MILDAGVQGLQGFQPECGMVLDELVQVSDAFYLGKAHVKWWWGKWQTVAYFTLAGGMAI